MPLRAGLGIWPQTPVAPHLGCLAILLHRAASCLQECFCVGWGGGRGLRRAILWGSRARLQCSICFCSKVNHSRKTEGKTSPLGWTLSGATACSHGSSLICLTLTIHQVRGGPCGDALVPHAPGHAAHRGRLRSTHRPRPQQGRREQEEGQCCAPWAGNTHTHTHTHTHANTHTRTHAHTRTHHTRISAVCVATFVCVCARACVCLYLCVCVCVCVSVCLSVSDLSLSLSLSTVSCGFLAVFSAGAPPRRARICCRTSTTSSTWCCTTGCATRPARSSPRSGTRWSGKEEPQSDLYWNPALPRTRPQIPRLASTHPQISCMRLKGGLAL